MSEYAAEPFYEKIAHKYHWFLSSWEGVMEREMESLVPLFKAHGVANILDCACGTGLQAIGLAKAGFRVVGSDVSQKMLDVAGGNAREAGFDFPLIRSDFRELRKNVTTVFDAVICMGNSIPHLMTDKDILQALESIRECIKNKGFVIFEFRNYDHLLSTRTKFLPMRINARKDDLIISILYVLDYLDNIIRFNVVYLTEDTRTGKTEMDVQIVDYNPILAANFRRLLENAGFREIGITETGPNLRFVAFK